MTTTGPMTTREMLEDLRDVLSREGRGKTPEECVRFAALRVEEFLEGLAGRSNRDDEEPVIRGSFPGEDRPFRGRAEEPATEHCPTCDGPAVKTLESVRPGDVDTVWISLADDTERMLARIAPLIERVAYEDRNALGRTARDLAVQLIEESWAE